MKVRTQCFSRFCWFYDKRDPLQLTLHHIRSEEDPTTLACKSAAYSEQDIDSGRRLAVLMIVKIKAPISTEAKIENLVRLNFFPSAASYRRFQIFMVIENV